MMHALALTMVLLAQAGPAHAGLHPRESDVYLELGSVTGLMAELDRAPVLRFLRDERLDGLFAELGESPDRPLKELVREGVSTALPEGGEVAWLDGLGTVSASLVALGPGSDGAPLLAFLVVADLPTAEQARALQAVLIARAKQHEPVVGAVPGMERIRWSTESGNWVWCAVIGARLVLGGGASQVEEYLERSEKGKPGLSSREDFQREIAGLGEGSATPVLWFVLRRSMEDVLGAMNKGNGTAASFLSQIPSDLNPLASARMARMQFDGQRFVTEMVSSEAGEAQARPVDPAWLEPVPAGSMLIFAHAFDGERAGKKVRELLEREEKGAAALSSLEQKLGFGPERVLARLGPGMAVYSGPLAGMGLPETRAWIGCEDPAAFTADFEALIGALGETMPGYQAKTKPYKVKRKGSDEKVEVPITTLTLPPDAIQIPMISLSPSFAPVGNKLVFGLSSMDVKNELKRVHGDGEPIVAGAKPLAALGFELPSETRSVIVMDWGKLLASLVAMVKAFAPMAGPESLPFDFNKLPPAEMFAQYFKPTFHYSKGIPGGLYRRNEACFGPETWFGVLGFAAASGGALGLGGAAPVEETAPPEPIGGGR
jgi:hypothetical protein